MDPPKRPGGGGSGGSGGGSASIITIGIGVGAGADAGRLGWNHVTALRRVMSDGEWGDGHDGL